MNDPILHLLGLAKRAGKLQIGEEPVGTVARARKAKLIVVAENATDNTKRRATHFSEQGNAPFLVLPSSKEEMGAILGRESVAMLAVTDAGLAGAIGDKLVALDPERYTVVGERLREKADRTLARQKEKRRHEKNAQKKKPWVAPPVKETPTESKPSALKIEPSLKKGKRMKIQKKSGNDAQT